MASGSSLQGLPAGRIPARLGSRKSVGRASDASPDAAGRTKHAALKMAWSRGSPRECAFLCGKTSWDTDEECADKPCKWAYDDFNADGSRRAANCYDCEKVFKNDYAKHGRKEFQRRLAKHKPTHDTFLERKAIYIERKKASCFDAFTCDCAGPFYCRYDMTRVPRDLPTLGLALSESNVCLHTRRFALG